VRLASLALGLVHGLASAEDCNYAATMVELRECLARERSAANVEMEQAYRRLLEEMRTIDKMDHGSRAQTLAAAQRAWRAFREKECQFEYERMSPGTGAGANALACALRLTRERTTGLARSTGETKR